MKKVRFMLAVAFIGISVMGTATAQTIAQKGTVGDCTWTLKSDGVLTISGSGVIPDFENEKTDAPWYDYRAEIKALVVEDGVVAIGKNAFKHCTAMSSATMANTVVAIGEAAFFHCRALKSVTIPSAKAIGRIAFSGCTLLEEVRIPKDCLLGEASFGGCKKLPQE